MIMMVIVALVWGYKLNSVMNDHENSLVAHDAYKSIFKISRMATICIFIDKQGINMMSWYFSMKIA